MAVRHQQRNVRQTQSSDGDFASILVDGSVVTWSQGAYGDNSIAGQDQLRNAQWIQDVGVAFAAILLRWICGNLRWMCGDLGQ